jgi:DNA-binding LacI/PurR family transcriptional regulator
MAAGVAPATVSVMLSGKRPVSPATRARIVAAIDELGYRANASAKALAHGRTDTIGLLIPPVGRPLSGFEVDFIASAVQEAHGGDYDVLVSTSLEEDRVFSRLVEEQRVDGMIVLEIYLEDHRVQRLLDYKVPFVAVGRVAEPSRTTFVDIDFDALVRAFVRHLADLRHEDIVLFNNPAPMYARGYGPAHRAQSGFRAACDEHGLRGEVVYCDSSAEAGLRATRELLAGGRPFTGMVVVNDYAIGGIYQALNLAGKRIPADVSVIGLADSRWAEALSPRMTAAQHPVVEMGTLAVQLLLALLAEPDRAPQHRLLLPPITLRESTGAVPVRARPEVPR